MTFKTYLRNRDLLFFLISTIIAYQILNGTDCLIDTLIYPIVKHYVFHDKQDINFIGVSINFNKLICLMIKILIIIVIIYVFYINFC